MSRISNNLNCLYYPFSRLLDEATLKYLLLVFDSITFIDEAEDVEWRRILMQRRAEEEDGHIFYSHEKLADDYNMLFESGAVQIINPALLSAGHSIQVAWATLADLSDDKFVDMASKPSLYGLPAIPLRGYSTLESDRPTWQAFTGKIAKPLLTDSQFVNNEHWASHILTHGRKNTAWGFSYEAGSAAILNFYLEASDELGLTPMTTSELHHRLILRKLKRAFTDDQDITEMVDDPNRKRIRTVFGQGEIIRMLSGLYPTECLNQVSFEEIIKFRKETQELRQKFIQEIEEVLRVIDSNPTTIAYDKDVVQAIQNIQSDFKELEDEMISIRDKILPAFIGALGYGVAGTSALGAFTSFLGGLSPTGVVLASALTTSSAFLLKALDLWNTKRATLRSQGSSVLYLAKVSQMLKG